MGSTALPLPGTTEGGWVCRCLKRHFQILGQVWYKSPRWLHSEAEGMGIVASLLYTETQFQKQMNKACGSRLSIIPVVEMPRR